jgi:hypothetical protein
MPNRFTLFLSCLIPCSGHARGSNFGPEPYASDERKRIFASKPAAQGSVDYDATNRPVPESKRITDLESGMPFHTLRPQAGPRDERSPHQRAVPSSEEAVLKGCKCGTTESHLFSVPEYATEPHIWLRITWIPCPVHPCAHSPPEAPEGSLLAPESSSYTSSIDEERRCLCNIYNQMRADPVASKKWYAEQCSIEFPSWIYEKPYGW